MGKCYSLLFSITLFCAPLAAQESSEYRLKAAFVERFTRFITWKDSTKLTSGVTIGIIGDENDAFLKFKEFFTSVPIQNTPVEVLNVTESDSISGFTILFITPSREEYLDSFFLKIQELESVLTIGDEESFCEKGVMISFKVEGDKLKFNMNPSAFEKGKLTASSFLLKMATIIETTLQVSGE